jgi:hypothetical protein
MSKKFKIIDENNNQRDFFFEMQKHSAHLRTEFTARQLCVYELFKKTIDLPGGIIELGVRNGANFFFLSKLLEIFNPSQRYDGIASKHLYGFDTFSGFPAISSEDVSSSSWFDMKVGGVPSDKTAFFEDFESFKKTSPLSERLHIVEGDVINTIPKFLEDNPGSRFSMVYFDMDIYEPTLFALENLWSRVVPGGVLVFDEYGFKEFPGESSAVDEFLQDKQEVLRSISWCSCPSAYLVKGASR